MKHAGARAVLLAIEEYGPELGLALSPEQADLLGRSLDLVLEANLHLNLTRITSPAEAARLHVLDSLTPLPELRQSPNGPVLDLGSGGGFPGIPLAITTERNVVLLDSVAKKGVAVSGIVDALGLANRVKCASARAEEFALAERESFSVVVARAVAPLPSLVELAAPFLRVEGVLIALKGSPDASELHAGAGVGRLVGMQQTSLRQLELPGGGERRTIVCYVRRGVAEVRLPRRIGLAQHSPLA